MPGKKIKSGVEGNKKNKIKNRFKINKNFYNYFKPFHLFFFFL